MFLLCGAYYYVAFAFGGTGGQLGGAGSERRPNRELYDDAQSTESLLVVHSMLPRLAPEASFKTFHIWPVITLPRSQTDWWPGWFSPLWVILT